MACTSTKGLQPCQLVCLNHNKPLPLQNQPAWANDPAGPYNPAVGQPAIPCSIVSTGCVSLQHQQAKVRHASPARQAKPSPARHKGTRPHPSKAAEQSTALTAHQRHKPPLASAGTASALLTTSLPPMPVSTISKRERGHRRETAPTNSCLSSTWHIAGAALTDAQYSPSSHTHNTHVPHPCAIT